MAKILLVEDDNNLREIYEARLLAEGYEIVSARDGEEALTVAMKERPDLIISDVMMPKISGFDMLDIIRSTEETKNAKVIMMTALSQAEDKERADKLGADRYLVKSQVTLEDVAKVAREVLNGESSAAPAAATATESAEPPTSLPTPVADPAPTAAAPAPEPTAVTPAPAANDDVSDAQSVDTTTIAPSTSPQPEPVIDPSSLASVQPTTPAADESTAIEAKELSQSIEDEQTAIAEQIESFIETKKTAEAPEADGQQAQTTSPETTTASAEATETVTSTVEAEPAAETDSEPKAPSATRKVIQPIGDPTESKKESLEALVRKEEEKADMEALAENMKGAAAMAAESAVQTPASTEHVAPEVAVTADGDLQVVGAPEESAPEESSAAAESSSTPEAPVIPHTNGTSMDGVIAPQSTPAPAPAETTAPTPKTDGPDPNTIAL